MIKPCKLNITFGKPLRFPDEVYKSKEGRNIIMTALTDALKELEKC